MLKEYVVIEVVKTMQQREKTLSALDKKMLCQEAQAIRSGEVGYLYTQHQVEQMKKLIGKSIDVYYEDGVYVCKLKDEELELLAYKVLQLKKLEQAHIWIPTELRKAIKKAKSERAVNRLFLEVLDRN